MSPLLKFLSRKIDRYLVQQLDPDYEFVFTGVYPEDDQAITDLDIKKVNNFMTLNEIREKRNLPKVKDGDIVLNPVYLQSQQMQMMGGVGSNDFMDEYTGESDGNAYKEFPNKKEETEKAENPMLKELESWISKGMPVNQRNS